MSWKYIVLLSHCGTSETEGHLYFEMLAERLMYLDDWENVSFEDKQQVVDLMIAVIRATSEKLQIEWENLTSGIPSGQYLFMPLSSVVR